MFCEQCGTELQQTTKFCPGCGKPAQAAQPAQPEITQPPAPEPAAPQPVYTPPPAAAAPEPVYQPPQQQTVADRIQQTAPAAPKRKSGSFAGSAALLCLGWLLVAAGVAGFYALYGIHASVWLDGAAKFAAPAGAGLALLAGLGIVLFSGLISRRIIETGLAAALVFAGAAIFAKPMLAPPPLVSMLPDDTWMFASMDMLRAFDYNNQYLDAYGKDRFFTDYAELLKIMKIQISLQDTMNKAVKLSAGWVSREAVFGIGGGKKPTVVLLIGSRNRKVAERNFPELLKLSMDSIKSMASMEPSAEKELAELDKLVTFEKRPYGKVNLYCSKAPSGADKEIEGLCWASVKNAVVLTFSEKSLKETIDSMSKPRTERQKNFTKVSQGSLKNSDQMMFMYLDFEKLMAEMGGGEIKDARVKKELAAVKGFSMEVGTRGLSAEVALSAHLDKSKVGGTEIVKQILDFKSDAHGVEEYLNAGNAMAFASINNLKHIIGIFRTEAPEEFKKMQEAPIFSDKALGALGDEIGVTLLDFNMRDKEPDIKMVVAVALNPQQKDSRAIIENALNTMFQKEGVTIEKIGADVLAIKGKDMPPGIAPQIGFSGKYVYFTLDAATMQDFRGKKKGKGTREKSMLQMKINAGRAMDGLGKVMNAVMNKPGAQAQQMDFTKFLSADMFPMTELSLFIATGQDRIDIILMQETSKDKMKSFSLKKYGEFIKAAMDGSLNNLFPRPGGQPGMPPSHGQQGPPDAQSFNNCATVLMYIGDGLVSYAAAHNGALSGVGNFTDVCGYGVTAQLGKGCAEQLTAAAQSMCNPGSVQFSVVSDAAFEVRGSAGNCCLCMTEMGMRPMTITECVPNGGCNCAHSDM